jgi:hypothetical protein
MCQLMYLDNMVEETSFLENCWQFRKRAVRGVYNRLYRLFFKIRGFFFKPAQTLDLPKSLSLQPGDWVKVRSKDEIYTTLNERKNFEGCLFIDEMKALCGKKFRVMKNVRSIFDERKLRMVKCRNMVLLEDAFCHGSWPFNNCDRCCYYFWKEAWLEKIDKS